MNLPEYRRELASAMEEYADAAEKASAMLHQRIGKANDAFFDDGNTPAREADYVRERRDRDRD